MEEKFNNRRKTVSTISRIPKRQEEEKKKTQKGLAFRLWWLFSFININYCWCNCVYWNFCE